MSLWFVSSISLKNVFSLGFLNVFLVSHWIWRFNNNIRCSVGFSIISDSVMLNVVILSQNTFITYFVFCPPCYFVRLYSYILYFVLLLLPVPTLTINGGSILHKDAILMVLGICLPIIKKLLSLVWCGQNYTSKLWKRIWIITRFCWNYLLLQNILLN